MFHKGRRIANHLRSPLAHKHTTISEHMPSSHRRYAEWSPARMMGEAEKIGPATVPLTLMRPNRQHPPCLISLIVTTTERSIDVN